MRYKHDRELIEFLGGYPEGVSTPEVVYCNYPYSYWENKAVLAFTHNQLCRMEANKEIRSESDGNRTVWKIN